MLVFENSGEIDIRLATLMGVNVKESSSPVGFFGTGLKYAIACLLRWGDDITIQSGESEFRFSVEPSTIRGKDFGLISMRSRYNHLVLGYTTDLGKNWVPWMVYRELWCNAHDEPEGSVYEIPFCPAATAGKTRILVSGRSLNSPHAARHEFLLDKSIAPIESSMSLDILPGPRNTLFYRGIAVQSLPKPSLYTYNIKEFLSLTEDRTAPSWTTNHIITRELTCLKNFEIIEATLMAPESYFESTLDYSYIANPGETWLHAVELLMKEHAESLPRSAKSKIVKPAARHCPTCGQTIPL